MKKVLVHWVEMQTLELPSQCPTDDPQAMIDWIDSRKKPLEDYVIKQSSRDFEIVNVEEV